MHEELAERFWQRVDKSGNCWLWTGGHSHKGYGTLQTGGRKNKKTHAAHRFVWELTYGPIPEGMCVCHICDVRGCVRPDHLWLGSYTDNNRDRAEKGRSADTHGERHPRAKLTWGLVAQIKAAYTGEPGNQKDLALRFGVNPASVSQIVRGKQWTVGG